MNSNINTDNDTINYEKRWPVALAIIILTFLLWLIPERISLIPTWIANISCIIMLVPILAVGKTNGAPVWLKTEKYLLRFFLIFVIIGNFMNMLNLVEDMLYKSSEINGIQLLASSVAVWIINIFMFSLIYWQIDRGGPESRINYSNISPDWFFSEESAPEKFVSKNWIPEYIDYLYLGYSTSTAFSTTDTMPVSSKAKLLMMIQSFISLIIIVVVGARAINIIGS